MNIMFSDLEQQVIQINHKLVLNGSNKILVLTCNDKKVSINEANIGYNGALNQTLIFNLTTYKAQRWLNVFHTALSYISK